MARMKIPEFSITESQAFLKQTDGTMAQLIDNVKLFAIPKKPLNFETFVSIITGQMLSGKAARTIFMRVKALTGDGTITPAKLHHVTDQQLRGAGMSWAKIRSVRDLIEHVETGKLKIRNLPYMTDDEVYQATTAVKGLGYWSAEMFLMFRLKRPDIFPACDVGIQNAISKLYGKDRKKTDFEKFSRRWRPHRTVACLYLWSYPDNPFPVKNNRQIAAQTNARRARPASSSRG